MEKTMMFKSPCQKFGIDTPTNATTILVLSIHEYCRIAEIMPVGMPIKIENNMLTNASSSVVGNRSAIS